MKWKDRLISDIYFSLEEIPFWKAVFSNEAQSKLPTIHLAIFSDCYLNLMYEGFKTIESRFSVNEIAPFNKIQTGDVVLVKRPGGNVESLFVAGEVRFYRNITPTKLDQLNKEFGARIKWDIDPDFLKNRVDSRFLTLIDITELTRIRPVMTQKKDKTGWAIIELGYRGTLFHF